MWHEESLKPSGHFNFSFVSVLAFRVSFIWTGGWSAPSGTDNRVVHDRRVLKVLGLDLLVSEHFCEMDNVRWHTAVEAICLCLCLLEIFLPFVIQGWPRGCVGRYEVERGELVPPVAQQQRWMTADFFSLDFLLVYFFPGVLSELRPSLYATGASVDCVVKKDHESCDCREVKWDEAFGKKFTARLHD